MITIGGKEWISLADEIYYGNRKIQEVYYGNKKVYPDREDESYDSDLYYIKVGGQINYEINGDPLMGHDIFRYTAYSRSDLSSWEIINEYINRTFNYSVDVKFSALFSAGNRIDYYLDNNGRIKLFDEKELLIHKPTILNNNTCRIEDLFLIFPNFRRMYLTDQEEENGIVDLNRTFCHTNGDDKTPFGGPLFMQPGFITHNIKISDDYLLQCIISISISPIPLLEFNHTEKYSNLSVAWRRDEMKPITIYENSFSTVTNNNIYKYKNFTYNPRYEYAIKNPYNNNSTIIPMFSLLNKHVRRGCDCLSFPIHLLGGEGADDIFKYYYTATVDYNGASPRYSWSNKYSLRQNLYAGLFPVYPYIDLDNENLPSLANVPITTCFFEGYGKDLDKKQLECNTSDFDNLLPATIIY